MRIRKGNKVMQMIKIRYLKDIDTLCTISKGDWIDLRCAEDAHIPHLGFKYIHLGVAIQLPEGYEAIVAPRSSTFKKYGILMANSVGIIDESYKGDNDEWMFPAFALQDCYIPFNARIAQFRIIRHQPTVFLKSVPMLGNENRGGFGSTGEK